MNPAVLSSETSIIVTFLASFLIWVMFAGIFFLWIVDGKVKRETAVHAILATILAWTVTVMLKSLLPVTRPFVTNEVFPLTLTFPDPNSSFPSSHSAVAFAMAISIWFHSKNIGNKFLILAILVAFGRVASNVHSTLDVIAGFVVGIVTAYLIKRIHAWKIV